MPKIEWDKSFSVNNAEIDNQHKNWVEIINELHDVLMGNDTEKFKNITSGSLKSMQEYAKKHFAYEEEYMREINYPGLAGHQQIHGHFHKLLNDYINDMQEGDLILNTSIMKVLMNWLQDHILNEDKKYSLYASEGE